MNERCKDDKTINQNENGKANKSEAKLKDETLKDVNGGIVSHYYPSTQKDEEYYKSFY